MPPYQFKDRQCLWNEEIHTFSPCGVNQFTHYVRLIAVKGPKGKFIPSSSVDDRPGKPELMTGGAVDAWIREHSAPALTEEDVSKAKWDMESKGKFGPMDNPKKGEE